MRELNVWDSCVIRHSCGAEQDIFTHQEETLPTFNSFAIYAHVHRIRGLSAKFILFNDDFFVGAPTTREDFVLRDGRLVLRLEKSTLHGGMEEWDRYKHGKLRTRSFTAKLYHTKGLLDARFGFDDKRDNEKFHFVKHAPVIMEKERIERMQEIWHDDFQKAIRLRFRSAGE